MQFSSRVKTDEEIEFVLQNLFIFIPNSHSRYKLRLVIRNHSSEERVVQDQQRYNFRFIFEDALMPDDQFGQIYLLEKGKKDVGTAHYRVIGVGKLDIISCSQREGYSSENQLVNGLIYGTKEVNDGKIIAKFSYKMQKRAQHQQDDANEFLSVNPLTISKRREKLPALTFRKSMANKNTEINNKLNNLTKQLDNELIQDKNNEKAKELSSTIEETLKYFGGVARSLFYQYSEKMIALIENSPKRCEMYKVTIKNIKINCIEYRKLQNLTSRACITPSHSTPNKNEGIRQQRYIWMCFYEIFEQFQFRRKLLELTTPIFYNQNNNLSKDVSFYMPQTSNRILIEIKQLQKRLESELIMGYIKYGDTLNKIIEVFNDQNQEKGFIIALFHKENTIPLSYLEEYKLQRQQFQNLITEHSPKKEQTHQKRYSLPSERQSRNHNRNEQDTPNIANIQPIQNHMYSKKQKKFRKIIHPEFFGRVMTQQNESFASKSRIFNIEQTTQLKKSRIKSVSIAPPSQSSSKVKVRLLNYDNSRRKLQLHQKLHLNSVSIVIQSPKFATVRKVLLKFQLNKEDYLKKVYVNRNSQQQVEWCDLNISFEEATVQSSLKIDCYYKQKGSAQESDYCELGRCRISVGQLKNVSTNIYRMLLVNANSIVGNLLLKFSLNQSRVLAYDQIKANQKYTPFLEKKKEEYELSSDSFAGNRTEEKQDLLRAQFNRQRKIINDERKSQIYKEPNI